MNIRDHLHNNSTLTIEIDGLDKDDKENEFITGETRFDWKLIIPFGLDHSIYEGKGDWLNDFVKYEGDCYDVVDTDLRSDLKTALINHILDLEG